MLLFQSKSQPSTETPDVQSPSASPWLWGCLIGTAALALTWLLIPSEWSFIDDPGLKLGIASSTHRFGFIGGVVHRIGALAADDRGWGLFRPAYWAYGAVFYLLQPPVAHALRAVMFGVVVCTPVVYLIRSDQSRRPSTRVLAFALVLMLANYPLYEGLSLLSLQELTGLFFVSLGLLTRRRPLRLLLWWVAA